MTDRDLVVSALVKKTVQHHYCIIPTALSTNSLFARLLPNQRRCSLSPPISKNFPLLGFNPTWYKSTPDCTYHNQVQAAFINLAHPTLVVSSCVIVPVSSMTSILGLRGTKSTKSTISEAGGKPVDIMLKFPKRYSSYMSRVIQIYIELLLLVKRCVAPVFPLSPLSSTALRTIYSEPSACAFFDCCCPPTSTSEILPSTCTTLRIPPCSSDVYLP